MDNTYQVTVAFNWEATVALDNEIKVSSNEFGIEATCFYAQTLYPYHISMDR